MPIQLVLIGLRGSGKTTLGQRLAAKHQRSFIDLDDRTPAVLGAPTVADAWKSRGEPAFRAAELAALKQAIAEAPDILALGGGTPTAPGALQLLNSLRNSGPTLVYLRASPGILAERLRLTDTSHRPSLTGRGVIEEVSDIFTARDPVYRGLADLVLDTDSHDAERTLAELAKVLTRDPPPSPPRRTPGSDPGP